MNQIHKVILCFLIVILGFGAVFYTFAFFAYVGQVGLIFTYLIINSLAITLCLYLCFYMELGHERSVHIVRVGMAIVSNFFIIVFLSEESNLWYAFFPSRFYLTIEYKILCALLYFSIVIGGLVLNTVAYYPMYIYRNNLFIMIHEKIENGLSLLNNIEAVTNGYEMNINMKENTKIEEVVNLIDMAGAEGFSEYYFEKQYLDIQEIQNISKVLTNKYGLIVQGRTTKEKCEYLVTVRNNIQYKLEQLLKGKFNLTHYKMIEKFNFF